MKDDMRDPHRVALERFRYTHALPRDGFILHVCEGILSGSRRQSRPK